MGILGKLVAQKDRVRVGNLEVVGSNPVQLLNLCMFFLVGETQNNKKGGGYETLEGYR